MSISLIGIDIAKNVFQLHGVDYAGNVKLRKRVLRAKLIKTIAQIAPCTIVMEACGGANHWSRQFSKFGHQVKLISPQYVKPFVKTNKNDRNDAEAITEAASRPSMYFVSGKTIEQQDIQNIHRIRERNIKQRTALCNQIRGILAEYGIIIPKGIGFLRKELSLILEDAENELTFLTRDLINELKEELIYLDSKIKALDKKVDALFKKSEMCQKLAEIPGFGKVIATAVVASVGNAKAFKNGRQLSAWVGLVPRQSSSGNKNVLLGISKRGDCYLRKNLVHGARSVVYRARHKTDRFSQWVNRISETRGVNKACIAVANKNMRIAWALLAQDEAYRSMD